MDVYDLAQLQQLRRFKLEYALVEGPPSSSLLCLPKLRQLTINGCPISASHFLTPAFLPQLRHVDADNLDEFAPLMPQLESITSDDVVEDYALLSAATSLHLLPLPDHPDPRLDMFSKLPSLPPFLHIRFPLSLVRNIQGAVVAALEALLETTKKSGLRVILLNDYGIGDSIDVLIQQFEELGVHVQ